MAEQDGKENNSLASSDARSPPSHHPPLTLRPMPSPTHSRGTSFNDQLRGTPASPRGSRPSLSSFDVQALIHDPPTAGAVDPAFAGRDWRDINVSELVNDKDLRFAEIDTGVEAATNLLIDSGAPVVLVRTKSTEKSAIGTFDYNDLNTFLLFAVKELHANDDNLAAIQDIARKAQRGERVALEDVKSLGTTEPFVTLAHTENLMRAVEIFGGGAHRIVIVKEGSSKVTGILSQLRLVKFLWENRASFPAINSLYGQCIKDLSLGSQHVFSIHGDKQLIEALKLMNAEGVTSLAVVDNQLNVIGNISSVDVKLLTSSSAKPLLYNTCIHFVSVILSSRGMDDGKDSYPVFHINPYTTLAYSVAKLVATQSHRMWVVDSPSPHSSGPPTPGYQTASIHPPHLLTPQPMPPLIPQGTSASVSASTLPGVHMSGRLSGVVSLTDVLNLFGRASGLHPSDPNETRRQRRSSSTSSTAIRGSLDSARSSSMDVSRR